MTAAPLAVQPASPASRVLGRKLDSIPFSRHHLMIIAVLGLIGFVDGYDLVMTGSLLVLAKAPLHMAPGQVRFLAVASTLMIVVGGFIASAISDHFSRKTIMLIGVAAITFCTLLISFVQTAEQLIILRLLTGLGGGFAVSAPFPIAAELMPARHRRTYGAIYEMCLAAAFSALPLVGLLLADNPNAFRLMALPGGLAFFVVPALVYFLIPESPRWYLRRARTEDAVETVNRIIRRGGNRVPPLTVAALGDSGPQTREQLPPYRALWGRGQLRWTLVGISSYVFAGTAFFLISVLLPKALVEQGGAVSTGFAVATLVFTASIPGKGFTGYLMEIIGRRWTIFYALAGAVPGLLLMMVAHNAGSLAATAMVFGALITGFTALSGATAFRVYLSEQFPTGLRGRGHVFSESVGRIFSAVLAPYLMEPHVGSPTIFFGTILLIVCVGAFVPLLFGRETRGQLELVTEAAPEPA
ncbi:MAG: MFS transporter [Alphaproteobacteria bacterium]|nr:MFS transporter [Alphaproteobacteria bacterium]MBV9016449.1 MFS transporter [Alphaproteobacteria bacterium]MBV9152449.1 MFS transporter [Alphaproteobacteria bacterium]MBV9583502.1 MFS transporter [Alphaproteobacteria bacterium]MBV9966368.1 MFS transporter [Alphaproteobacteria bacterium]